jgi:hypothetical protein
MYIGDYALYILATIAFLLEFWPWNKRGFSWMNLGFALLTFSLVI